MGGIEGGRTELELCHSGGRREGGQEISQEAVAMIRAQSKRGSLRALRLCHSVMWSGGQQTLSHIEMVRNADSEPHPDLLV